MASSTNDISKNLFEGRTVAIVTKHGKEQVIAPLLKEGLGINQFVIPAVDTDQLGTFTGEIERMGSPIDALRNKCELACAISDCDLVIASEGSFGPHPSLFFVPADDEWILLKDYKNNLELLVREMSTETNFGGGTFTSLEEVIAFADRSKFPSHALIVKAGEKDFRHIQKGILSQERLTQEVLSCLAAYNQTHVETDMRAHMNPTRMAVIQRAMEKLVRKANSFCPSCHLPGFDVVAIGEGLPCIQCNTPTHLTLYRVEACTGCGFFNYVFYPLDKRTTDPQNCPRCNP